MHSNNVNNIINGDLVDLGKQGLFDVIIHGCNCFHKMNSGIAKQIRKEFPQAYEADCKQSEYGSKLKLGTFTHSITNNGLIVVNAYTQYNYGYNGKRYVDYDAVRNVMKRIKISFTGMRIGYPKIGCGLAGGDWNIVSQIINEELDGEDHTLVNFI